MIDQKQAAGQVERLCGLDFFPKEKAARKELLLAAQSADSEEILKMAVADWVAERGQCPKPSELRRVINSLNEKFHTAVAKCSICFGAGVVTIWKLITYKGKSFTVLRAETLPDVNDTESANAFIAKLMEHEMLNPPANRQTVLTAAKNCVCRAAKAS